MAPNKSSVNHPNIRSATQEMTSSCPSNCWKLFQLYRPTVEPIILLCMANIAISSVAFQSFLFERICYQFVSDNPLIFNVSSTSPSGLSTQNALWGNGTGKYHPNYNEFCKHQIKRVEYSYEHKTISAETSRVLFYGYKFEIYNYIHVFRL